MGGEGCRIEVEGRRTSSGRAFISLFIFSVMPRAALKRYDRDEAKHAGEISIPSLNR